jgi:very-short-patch-repair endonuclease
VTIATPLCHVVTSPPQGGRSQRAIEGNAIYDAVRTKRLENDGWIVLRFWNDDVLKDIGGVCAHILKVLGKDHHD